MKKIRISAVSYTNTKPFIYGLQHSDILERAELSLDNPSACAQKLIDNEADIGLVPVASLHHIPDFQIISDYCIGASQAVNSVFIFSNVPVEQIKSLKLDNQSRTSNMLAKVLLKNFWKVQPEYIFSGDTIQADAFVEIGDRTFGKKNKYPFAYDLAEHWINFTGLPFVFAVWATNKEISPEFLKDFNTALKIGLDNRSALIKNIPQFKDFDLEDYLMNRIDFIFDEKKKQALEIFLAYAKLQAD